MLTTPIRGESAHPRQGRIGIDQKVRPIFELIQTGSGIVSLPIQKKEDTYRIAILGDSYMEARQVALKDMFGRKLEDYLQKLSL